MVGLACRIESFDQLASLIEAPIDQRSVNQRTLQRSPWLNNCSKLSQARNGNWVLMKHLAYKISMDVPHRLHILITTKCTRILTYKIKVLNNYTAFYIIAYRADFKFVFWRRFPQISWDHDIFIIHSRHEYVLVLVSRAN